MTRESKLLIILTVFLSSLGIINVIAIKIVAVGDLQFPAGALAYAFTFLCTDIIAESWGKDKARQVVWLGLLANVVVVFLVVLAVQLPAAPMWANNDEAFRNVLGSAPRILVASMTAYLISQMHDVWAFHYWKAKTGERWLWLRNNASTAVSQLIDTVLFVGIAFAGSVNSSDLVAIVLSHYLVKLIIAVIDTPFVYLGVRWVRGGT